MINDTFGVGVAGAALTAGTSHAAHAAVTPAAAVKHRAAAATDASVDSGSTEWLRNQPGFTKWPRTRSHQDPWP